MAGFRNLVVWKRFMLCAAPLHNMLHEVGHVGPDGRQPSNTLLVAALHGVFRP